MLTATSPLWYSPQQTVHASAPAAVRTLDPMVVTVVLAVALLSAVAFRGPITEALGTAPAEMPAIIAIDLPPLIETSTAQFPRHDRSPADVELTRDPFSRPGVRVSGTETVAARADTRPSYRVESGDSLWSITQHALGADASVAAVAAGWRSVFTANRAAIGADPGSLVRGLVLDLAAVRD